MRFWLGALIGFFGGFIGSVILGIYGNQWAWGHRKFKNTDEFLKVQQSWAIWGFVYFVLCTLFVLLVFSGSLVQYGLSVESINNFLGK